MTDDQKKMLKNIAVPVVALAAVGFAIWQILSPDPKPEGAASTPQGQKIAEEAKANVEAAQKASIRPGQPPPPPPPTVAPPNSAAPFKPVQ